MISRTSASHTLLEHKGICRSLCVIFTSSVTLDRDNSTEALEKFMCQEKRRVSVLLKGALCLTIGNNAEKGFQNKLAEKLAEFQVLALMLNYSPRLGHRDIRFRFHFYTHKLFYPSQLWRSTCVPFLPSYFSQDTTLSTRLSKEATLKSRFLSLMHTLTLSSKKT